MHGKICRKVWPLEGHTLSTTFLNLLYIPYNQVQNPRIIVVWVWYEYPKKTHNILGNNIPSGKFNYLSYYHINLCVALFLIILDVARTMCSLWSYLPNSWSKMEISVTFKVVQYSPFLIYFPHEYQVVWKRLTSAFDNIRPSIEIINMSLNMDPFYLERKYLKNRHLLISVIIWYIL